MKGNWICPKCSNLNPYHRKRCAFCQEPRPRGGLAMLDCLIASPPYADSIHRGQAGGTTDHGEPHRRKGLKEDHSYGSTPGQLGAMKEGEPMSDDLPGQTILPTATWEGCYDDSWKGILTPESFAHPAKMTRGLLCRILDFMLSEGWLRKGDTILDPFSGVSTTAIEAASRGLQAVGVELEKRFHDLALANLELHRRKWTQFGDPMPVLINGDSRRLAALLGEAGALVGSPPYAESNQNYTETAGCKERLAAKGEPKTGCGIMRGKNSMTQNYGSAPGQLGNLREGSLDAAIGYGTAEGQLGAESGTTFWEAAALIVRQCYAVLKPGAYCAWVCKDFCRNGERVRFSRDWLRLCVACGFEPVLWVQASLVKETSEPGLFGQPLTTKKERKSFFRRLHERKLAEDDPRRIDEEDVLFLRRPA